MMPGCFSSERGNSSKGSRKFLTHFIELLATQKTKFAPAHFKLRLPTTDIVTAAALQHKMNISSHIFNGSCIESVVK